ncbi:MAG: phenylalanine--tRNA ligase subunit beta [Gammaproteobacteria bacterium]|nr:phenylalanine--tRNA ligase subunit beta [Gammaproteobacteria bacterium]
MKVSIAWLREWVDPLPDARTVASQLTLAGLEVGGTEPAAPEFSGVIVGKVLGVARHPDADKLSVCQVDAGSDERLSIVCGAPNVHAGMTAPLAMVGARLPDGAQIRAARLRGVESQGMLCSGKELGLSQDASGILALPETLIAGMDLREALTLDDSVLDLELTPNRGDCLSVAGVARELAVINRTRLTPAPVEPVTAVIEDRFAVEVQAANACPRFVGRVIRGIDGTAAAPFWMIERLRRSGIRSIHPVVDVTNYVMLELGQPMHGYDLARLEDRIIVRLARPGEKLELLDGRTVPLDSDVLVIADGSGAIGMAGIMGGEVTGVSATTRDVFLESAFFAPAAIAARARRYGLTTDASQRFERGVDYEMQARAMERATGLLLDMAGGTPGPLTEICASSGLPQRAAVSLRRERLERLLGLRIADDRVGDILRRLGMRVAATGQGWQVTPPSFRFDVAIAEDLVEEIARIHGYDQVPETDAQIPQQFAAHDEARVDTARMKLLLVDRGYQETITYSFVDPALQSLLAPGTEAVELANPISSEMSVMRVSLWPGLVAVARENLNRQQERLRIFEIGVRFLAQGPDVLEQKVCAGLVIGSPAPEQWSLKGEAADVYDVKSDVEAVLRLSGRFDAFRFETAAHPILRPGQSAHILRDGSVVGWLGELHPEIARQLALTFPPLLFEFDFEAATAGRVPVFASISRFPAIRRDLALVVPEAVPFAKLREVARRAAGELLQSVEVFDVYRGAGIDSGLKSIALSLILQDSSRTLTVEDADAVVQAVVTRLGEELEARIRD